MSHDLKTPLTSIINYSDLLFKDDNSEDEVKEYSKIINEKSNKLKVLIEDLFEVSKASSNNIELDRQELDFNSLVQQSIGEWEDKIKENNIKIISNLPEEKVMLNIDGQKFSRVLDNLFSNISKYALENSRVYVDLIEEDGVKLTIKNISKYPLNISTEELMERFTQWRKIKDNIRLRSWPINSLILCESSRSKLWHRNWRRLIQDYHRILKQKFLRF